MLNDALRKEIDRLSEEEENRDKARSLMLLSLFVLILAFFIVLVALSVLVEEKVRVGLASVREVFQAINDDSEIGVILPEDLSPGFTAGDILEDIAVVIVGEIQILELTMANDRRNLVVRLPLSDFFDLDSGEILENRRFLLRRIAAALEQGGGEVTSHILVRGPQSEASITGMPSLAMIRAGAFAESLESLGAQASQIYAGVEKNDRSEIFIHFTTKSEAVPQIHFRALALQESAGQTSP